MGVNEGLLCWCLIMSTILKMISLLINKVLRVFKSSAKLGVYFFCDKNFNYLKYLLGLVEFGGKYAKNVLK